MIELDKIINRIMFITLSILMLYFIIIWSVGDIGFKKFTIMFLLLIMMMVITCASYKKFKNTTVYRNICTTVVTILFAFFVLYLGNNESYIIGMVLLIAFLIYYDVKLVLRLTICLASILAIYFVLCLKRGTMPENNPVTFLSLLLPGAFVFFYGCTLAFATWYAKKINDERLNTVQNAKDKTEILLNELIETSNKIKERVNNCTQHITELDEATTNSNLVFDKISEGNISNVNSIEIQNEMSLKIIDYINRVKSDTKQATMNTNTSMNELLESNETVIELLNMSYNIININSKLYDTINRFNEHVEDIQYISNEIMAISEQTNLLTLYASIESSKAGKASKGFNVVTESIKRLSDSTINLTNTIESIMSKVQNGAFKAKEMINLIEKTIEEESNTIKDTISAFTVMKEKIRTLKTVMNNVFLSTTNVLKYNSSIIVHIEQLTAQTEEVTAYIEEALGLNNLNKQKAHSTKNFMRELNIIVDDLVKNNSTL